MATATVDELALHSGRGRVALAATVAASAMASLDATIVNVALPHIGRDLDASVSSLQWVLTGYLLALASLILLGGALGDRFGRRRVFVLGCAWFAVASVLCGFAPSVDFLIAARVLQGVGGALLTPGSLAIIQSSFRSEDRPAAIGAWSGLGGAAGAVGPFLGGAIVDGPGWRYAFFLSAPVALGAIACARAAVPETRDEHATGSLDVLGAVLGSATLATATWGLIEAGPRGLGDASVVLALALAVALGAAFVAHLRRRRNPLVPPSLFRDRTFTVVNLGTALLYTSIGLAFFLVAYQLQVAAGWSAFDAGLAMLPATLLMLALSARSGALAQRIGPTTQLTIGPLVAAAGLLLLTRVGADPVWVTDVLPDAVLFGLGLVTFVAPLTATVMAAADPDHVSVASGVNNAIARAASLAGLAALPVAAGLTSAVGAAAVTDAYRSALVLAAAVAGAAGPLMYLGLRGPIRLGHPLRRYHCAVDGPPVGPDPRRCGAPTATA